MRVTPGSRYGSHDIAIWVKTTIDIADRLLADAKKAAENRGTTLRALVEEGLRRVLKNGAKSTNFRLRKATFRGQGLQPPLEGASWEQIRELTYKGRGA